MRIRSAVSQPLALGLLLVLSVFLPACPCSATEYLVRPDGSGEFPTIQAALDAVVDGDEVVLADGTFRGPGNANLHFFGKAITLRSQSGDPATCLIDCQGGGTRGLIFDAGETRSTRVESITVDRGTSFDPEEPGGGGARCQLSSPTLHRVAFTRCVATRGNGLSAYGGSPLLEACTFANSGCSIPGQGGAIYTVGSHLEIEDCVFEANCDSEGGAIWSSDGAVLHIVRSVFTCNIGSGAALSCRGTSVQLSNCTLYYNLGWDEAQIQLSGGSQLTADHTIIAFGHQVAAVQCLGGSTAALSCCDVYGNDGGDWIGCLAGQQNADDNLWADPIFCTMATFDPHLRSDSPCVEVNNPTCGQIGALGVGCDAPVPVLNRSWGRIKSMFRGANHPREAKSDED